MCKINSKNKLPRVSLIAIKMKLEKRLEKVPYEIAEPIKPRLFLGLNFLVLSFSTLVFARVIEKFSYFADKSSPLLLFFAIAIFLNVVHCLILINKLYNSIIEEKILK